MSDVPFVVYILIEVFDHCSHDKLNASWIINNVVVISQYHLAVAGGSLCQRASISRTHRYREVVLTAWSPDFFCNKL
jgi:hypothetical protein